MTSGRSRYGACDRKPAQLLGPERVVYTHLAAQLLLRSQCKSCRTAAPSPGVSQRLHRLKSKVNVTCTRRVLQQLQTLQLQSLKYCRQKQHSAQTLSRLFPASRHHGALDGLTTCCPCSSTFQHSSTCSSPQAGSNRNNRRCCRCCSEPGLISNSIKPCCPCQHHCPQHLF